MIKRLLLLLIPVMACAQQGNLPLNHQWMWESEAQMVISKGFRFSNHLLHYESDSVLAALKNYPDTTGISDPVVVAWPMHTSVRPLMEQGHGLRQYYNSHNYGGPDERTFIRHKRKGLLYYLDHYHRDRSLLQVEKSAQGDIPLFRLYIDPQLNLQKSYLQNDTASENLYINTRGVTARGDIGTKVSFETSFWENQAFLPSFQDSFALKYGVMPGMGRWKRFKNTGYDYAMASGMLSWSVCRYFNVQVGHGKHFFGDGYRSLFLSDNSFNYPYARFTGWIGHDRNLQYTVLYTSFMNLTGGQVSVPPGTERLFQKKSGVFHHLSWRFLRQFEVSLFHGAIYQHADSLNKQDLGFWYFNPVMFASMARYGLNNANNYMLGATVRADLLQRFTLYGQWVLDGVNNGDPKQGLQAGLKCYNLLGVKHLHLRVELNKVSAFTYQASDSLQSWTHYNQALAHPLGAGFTEINGSLNYKWRDLFVQVSGFTASTNLDTSGYNAGQDIFRSNLIRHDGKGVSAKLVTLDAHLGYMISYASNFNLSVGYQVRNLSWNGNSDKRSFVYLALRTSLTNNTFDFF